MRDGNSEAVKDVFGLRGKFAASDSDIFFFSE
jgi:hypothetical protein